MAWVSLDGGGAGCGIIRLARGITEVVVTGVLRGITGVVINGLLGGMINVRLSI